MTDQFEMHNVNDIKIHIPRPDPKIQKALRHPKRFLRSRPRVYFFGFSALRVASSSTPVTLNFHPACKPLNASRVIAPNTP